MSNYLDNQLEKSLRYYAGLQGMGKNHPPIEVLAKKYGKSRAEILRRLQAIQGKTPA